MREELGLLDFLWDRDLNTVNEAKAKLFLASLTDDQSRADPWVLDQIRLLLDRLRMQQARAHVQLWEAKEQVIRRRAELSGRRSSEWSDHERERYQAVQLDALLHEDDDLSDLLRKVREAEQEYEILLAKSEWVQSVRSHLEKGTGSFLRKRPSRKEIEYANAILYVRNAYPGRIEFSAYQWAGKVGSRVHKSNGEPVESQAVTNFLTKKFVIKKGEKARDVVKYMPRAEKWAESILRDAGD